MSQETGAQLKAKPFLNGPYRLAFQDIVEGIKAWRIWMFLAWQDISLRYRRSFLGPFWITINMAITIYMLGFLYGRLFKIDLTEYYPNLAAGLLSWSFISITITDLVTTFSTAQDYIKQIKLPYFLYVLRVVAKNLIVFFHTMIVFIPIMLIFNVKIGWATWLIVPSLLLIATAGIVYGLFLGMIGARFRDLAVIIGSILHIIFFMTPVLWPITVLPERYRYLVKFNPFAQAIELIRHPLLGKLPSAFAFLDILGFILIGAVVIFIIFAKKRKQIIYWL